MSAHFLVGKQGQVHQTLRVEDRAWHAGVVSSPLYNNNNTIGIECHYTPGESTYLPNLYKALKELCEYLIATYTITGTVLHRHVAIPKGRKQDPSFWSDRDYNAWRINVLGLVQRRTIKAGAMLSTRPDTLVPATHINDSGIVRGEFVQNREYLIKVQNDHWCHITNGIGFVEKKFIL